MTLDERIEAAATAIRSFVAEVEVASRGQRTPDPMVNAEKFARLAVRAALPELFADKPTHALVAIEPCDGLLVSMAVRDNHGFGLLPIEQRLRAVVAMRQLHEEVVGTGFYKPENDDFYTSMLKATA